MKHSQQYKAIRRRPLKQWWARNKSMIMFAVATIVLAIIMMLAITWQARADEINYQQVHKCIGAYKAMNQIGWKPLHEVAQCTHNPYIIT